MAMGLAIPVHSLIGMQGVVSDYVPPALQRPVRLGVVGAAGVMGLGFLKLNLLGPGVTRSINQFWSSSPSK